MAELIDKLFQKDINIIKTLASRATQLCPCPKIARIIPLQPLVNQAVSKIQQKILLISVWSWEENLGVFDDCDLEGAVNGIIAGNFGASGQSCVAGSRVFIQKNIYSKVLKKIKERAEKIIIGDPLDDKTQVGPWQQNYKWNVQKKSLWNLSNRVPS